MSLTSLISRDVEQNNYSIVLRGICFFIWQQHFGAVGSFLQGARRRIISILCFFVLSLSGRGTYFCIFSVVWRHRPIDVPLHCRCVGWGNSSSSSSNSSNNENNNGHNNNRRQPAFDVLCIAFSPCFAKLSAVRDQISWRSFSGQNRFGTCVRQGNR